MANEEALHERGVVVDPPVEIETEPKETKAKKAKAAGGKKKGSKTGAGEKKPAARKSAAKGTGKKAAPRTKAKSSKGAVEAPALVEKSVVEQVTGEVSSVATTSAPVTVLQGAQLRLAQAQQQITVEPAPTVIAQVVPTIVKVRNIDATLTNITSHVIPNKVIVQGLVHLQIFFVQSDQMVHHLAEDVPFNTMLDIPGATPGMNAIVQPTVAAVLFHLNAEGTALVKKIIIDVFAKVVEEVQIRPLPGTGPLLLLQEVVGEGITQTLNENFVTLAVPAIKVEEIRGTIMDVTTEVIPDKVIIQGTIHKQIFFVGTDNIGRHQAEDVHFSAFADVPGAAPGMNIQVHPRIETIIFELLEPTVLRQKVVVEIFVKVTNSIEFQAALGEGPLLRVPEIVGEGQGQILRRDVVTLDLPALKVREIVTTLTNLRSHVIPGKAILQGTIHKQIFFIGLADNIEHHQAEDVPFSIMVDIPGAVAGLDLVAEPVIESVIFNLLSPTELEEKVIIFARLILVEQRQSRLVLGNGPLVKVEQVVGENLSQVLVRLVNQIAAVKRVSAITVVSPVAGEITFRQQIIVENEVTLPITAIKIAEVNATIENLRTQIIPSGLLVEGNVVKDIRFVGTDNVVRNIEEVVPFSLIISIPNAQSAQITMVEVQIEQILFSISPDGQTVRQVIVLSATATVVESITETFQVINDLVVPGLNVETVLVEAPVQIPGGVQVQQFNVITGLSGPGLSLLVNPVFSVHNFQVVGDGVQALNVLESVGLLDP